MNLQRFRTLMRRAVMLPVLGLLVLSGIFILQIYRLQDAMTKVDADDRAMTTVSRFLRHAVDAETGLRGFEVTGDKLFLQPYREALPQTADELRELQRELAADTQQAANVRALQQSFAAWSSFSQQVVQMQAAGSDVQTVALNLEGKRLMDDVRAKVSNIVDRETVIRDSGSMTARRGTRDILIVTILAGLLFGLLLGLYTRNELVLVSTAYEESLRESERRAAEVAESEQWLRTTLKSIGDAVISCDASGNVEFMNPVAETLCGWTSVEARGEPLQRVFNIVNEQTRKLVENPVDKVCRLNSVVGLANHTVLISRDGSEYSIDDSGAPIRDPEGKIAGVVLVFRDITEQKRVEQAVIATEKLAVAGRLAASIAHEIHNPLDSVANLLYLMEQDGGASNSYLAIAREELTRVTQISRAMLSVYRESRTPVPADIPDLMDSVLTLLDRKLQDNMMDVDLHQEPVQVECFPSELRQVFINLISNAAEASSTGSTIRIRIAAIPPNTLTTLPQGGARVDISDQGSGIPQAVREKLFTPFFTTKGEQGTGLGLWLSRSMVEKHGGTILVSSSTDAANHGTTFTVLLPSRVLVPSSAVA